MYTIIFLITMELSLIRRYVQQNSIKSHMNHGSDVRIDPEALYRINEAAQRDIFLVGTEIYDFDELAKAFPCVLIDGFDKDSVFQKMYVELDKSGEPIMAFSYDMMDSMMMDKSHQVVQTCCYYAGEEWEDFRQLNKFVSAINRFKGSGMLEGIFKSCAGLIGDSGTSTKVPAIADKPAEASVQDVACNLVNQSDQDQAEYNFENIDADFAGFDFSALDEMLTKYTSKT